MADLTAQQIGEYTGCTHGDGGKRLYGCITCAIRWHEQQYEEFQERANSYWNKLQKLRVQQERGPDKAPVESGK